MPSSSSRPMMEYAPSARQSNDKRLAVLASFSPSRMPSSGEPSLGPLGTASAGPMNNDRCTDLKWAGLWSHNHVGFGSADELGSRTGLG